MTQTGDMALLDLWERVDGVSLAARPAVLLDGLRPFAGQAAAEPAETLPIGRRDRALIELRACLFGAEMRCAAACPGCGERIELCFDLGAIRAAPSAKTTQVVSGSAAIRLRSPTTQDILDALSAPADAQTTALVQVCALDPLPDPLPTALIEEASAALAEADPDAEIELATECPTCGFEHALMFDIGTCLWDDLTRAARRLLREVHHLATAYGWSEAEVLAVPRRRRLEYMMIQGV
jgi:hypothetical protein